MIFYRFCFFILFLLYNFAALAKEDDKTELTIIQQSIVDVTTNLEDKKSIAKKFANWNIINQNEEINFYVEQQKENELSQVYYDLMDKLFSNIVTDRESIDKAQALNTLENCEDIYCKLYKAYFLATTGRKDEARLIIEPFVAAKKATDESCYFRHHIYGEYDPENKLKDFKSYIAYFIFKYSRCHLSSIGEDYGYNRIPYWLILEVPQILDFRSERYSPNIYVPAEKLIRSLPSYKNFRNILNVIDGESFGTIMIDYWAMYDAYVEKISIAPELFELSTDFDHNKEFLPVFIWSYKGIWNRYKYLQLVKYANQIYSELTDFYLKNNKVEYAPKAQQLIDKYIAFRYDGNGGADQNLLDEKAFKIFTQHHDLAEIKTLTKDFGIHDFNVALKLAILNNYDIETIKWLLSRGADVNFVHYNEALLMSAADRPEIVALLLVGGANVNAQNSFGKTALFYAIQFNNLDSVKLLVQAGAEINHQLQSIEEINAHKFDAELDTEINIVGNFTPLAYAKKYASKELIEFLEKAGAKLIVSEENVQKWIDETVN